MDIFKQFDTYSLEARVFPALIAGLPTLGLLLVIVPWNDLGLPNMIATALGIILLFAFADFGRRKGKTIQEKLKTDATPEQWHRGNQDLAELAKDRYRTFMERQIGKKAPTEAEEKSGPTLANDFYLTANNWLREHTRDTKSFSILLKENIAYGFRRNLLGLKPLSLVANLFVSLVSVSVLYFKPEYFSTLPDIKQKLVVILATVFLHSMYILIAVNKHGVIEASQTYGRQLILCCEKLMTNHQPQAASKKGPKKENVDR